jgi:LacI family transcriptional regulator
MGRITQKSLARMLGCDISTISRALRDDPRVTPATKARIRACADKLGYVPDPAAAALVSGRSRVVGIILPELRHIFYNELFEGFSRAALEHDLVAELFLTGFDPLTLEKIISRIRSQRPGGIILGYHQLSFPGLKERLKKEFPVVLIDQDPVEEYDSVSVDSAPAIAETANYLVRLGHRRIGFVADSYASPTRGTLFHAALKSLGVPDTQQLVVQKSGRSEEVGYQAGLELLSRPDRPTAVFCVNDLIAVGLMKAAFELNVPVPAALSIVGFDDLPLSDYLPVPLTTIRQPIQEIVRHSFRVLADRMRTPRGKREHLVLPSALVIRKSTTTVRSEP